jgi:hypothetical protein
MTTLPLRLSLRRFDEQLHLELLQMLWWPPFLLVFLWVSAAYNSEEKKIESSCAMHQVLEEKPT